MNGKFAKWSLVQLLTIIMIVAAGTAFAAGEALMHNSDNLGTTKYGVWGGQFTCTTCHSGTTTANIKKIVAVIPDTIGPNVNKPVTFNNMTGFGDDAGGHLTSARICEVCHTQTTVHRYATTGQSDLDHKGANQTDCTICHSHADAFKGKGCTACHGSVAGSGNEIITGKHTAHISNAGVLGVNYGCVDCHAKSVTDDATIKSAPTAHQNSTFGDYSGARAGGSYAAGNCANVYCHTNGKGAAPATAVNWAAGPALDCKGCHGGGSSQAGEPRYPNGGAGATDANSHLSLKHVGVSDAASCQNCHGATMSGTALNASGKHTDRVIDVVQGNSKTFTYTAGSKTCSTASCHSNGFFTAADAQWGATLTCAGCHATGAIATGGHQSHLTHVGITCANCHYSTTSDNVTITGATHIDGTVSLLAGGTFNSQAVTFTPAGSGCNNISCHGGASAPDWTAQATCETCHPKGNLSGAHLVHMGSLNLAGGSIYYNMTANRSLAITDADTTYRLLGRTHGFGCGECHPMDPANHLNGDINVDLNRVGVAGVSVLRFLNHSTAAYDMAGTKKCSNMYCHSNASRVEAESNVKANTSLAWNDTFAAHPEIDRCAACHANQPTTGAHAAHSVGNHYENIYNGKSGKVATSDRKNTAHGNPNNSTTIGCYICHYATVTSKANDKNLKCVGCHFSGNTVGAILKGAATINNLQNHVNGAREIQFQAIKVVSKAQIRPESFKFYSGVWQRTSYKNFSTLSYDTAKVALYTATMWHPSTPMASNCTNIACHNGKPVAWNLANWNDPNKCMDCHNQL